SARPTPDLSRLPPKLGEAVVCPVNLGLHLRSAVTATVGLVDGKLTSEADEVLGELARLVLLRLRGVAVDTAERAGAAAREDVSGSLSAPGAAAVIPKTHRASFHQVGVTSPVP